MNKGSLIAVVILALYIGVEAYAIRKVSHRIEPGYIHALLIRAQHATQACESEALALAPRFAQTLLRVSASYRQELAETNPELSPEDIDNRLAREIADANTEISQTIASVGCEDAEIKAHFQRYRIYAKKTR